jgi:hypothetical protein
MTEVELQTFVQEFTTFQIWREYAAYARDIYGAAAERIEIVTGSDYNDEYSYMIVESVEVANAADVQLTPDLSTDWWQSKLGELPTDERAPLSRDDELYEDWIDDAIGERRSALPVLDGGYDRFFISRPPERTYRSLYVQAGEE